MHCQSWCVAATLSNHNLCCLDGVVVHSACGHCLLLSFLLGYCVWSVDVESIIPATTCCDRQKTELRTCCHYGSVIDNKSMSARQCHWWLGQEWSCFVQRWHGLLWHTGYWQQENASVMHHICDGSSALSASMRGWCSHMYGVVYWLQPASTLLFSKEHFHVLWHGRQNILCDFHQCMMLGQMCQTLMRASTQYTVQNMSLD